MLKIEVGNLLQWARYIETIPQRTKAAAARAINAAGEEVVIGMATQIADKADLPVHEVAALIEVREATPQRLIWEADASNIAPPSHDWSRPMASRAGKQFQKQTLVNIITSGDRWTCEVCEKAAEEGPYTQGEIDRMVEKWKDFQPATGPAPGFRTNLVHPNCRCVLTPFTPKRRLTVQWGKKGIPDVVITPRALGQRVAGELRIALKVTGRFKR